MGDVGIFTRQILSGDDAFYNQPDYEKVTRQEMDSSKPLKPIYTCNTEHKAWRIAKDIFSIIIFPIGLYRLLQLVVGKVVLIASNPRLMGYHPDHANISRRAIGLSDEWKIKRIAVKVDGYVVDGAIIGKASTLGNGRWFLHGGGNGEFYEDTLKDNSFKRILSEAKSNAIVFNYPGVGSSSGMPCRSAMSKAYRAMLNFLEDQEKGIGAREIIGHGHSIGGGAQGDALRSHPLKQGVKYVFVKSRTFSDLSTVASHMFFKPLGIVIKILHCNMDSVKSSKALKAPEIIMQTADVSDYTDISGQPEKIRHDGIISPKISLAKVLLEDEKCPKENKYFMGIPEGHNSGLRDPVPLVKKINEMIEQQA